MLIALGDHVCLLGYILRIYMGVYCMSLKFCNTINKKTLFCWGTKHSNARYQHLLKQTRMSYCLFRLTLLAGACKSEGISVRPDLHSTYDKWMYIVYLRTEICIFSEQRKISLSGVVFRLPILRIKDLENTIRK